MSGLKLTKTRMTGGIWEGELTGVVGDSAPELSVSHLDEAVAGLEVFENAGVWQVRVPVPAERISDGVQTFLIKQDETGDVLASFAILSDEVMADDVVAEVNLLRAELDMLKRAFRRHCVETS